MADAINKTFVYTTIIYVVTLLYGMNFILSATSLGLLSSDLLLISFIVLLPLLFYALYLLRSRAEFLYGKTGILTKLIFVTVVISALFTAFIIIPLSY